MNDVQAQNTTARSNPSRSRGEQRDRLIRCAEDAIAAHGLAGLRARDLAACAGVSLGAIYNLVADLDELVLLVGQRTMAKLDVALERADARDGHRDGHRDGDVGGQLIVWARAYAAFAAGHRELWRALFEFRMAAPRDFPDWFAAEQVKLFVRLETHLAPLMPRLAPAARGVRARALFAAVHGIVALGLEGKIVALPPEAIDAELVAFVETYVAGLARG